MKHIKLFENYFSDKLDKIISDMKKHKVGYIIHYTTLYNYISALHDFDLDNEFIEDFITSKSKFELKLLDISKLDLGDVSQTLVDEYKDEYLKTGWYPPILYNQEEDIIIDGYHRVKLLEDLNQKNVLVWC